MYNEADYDALDEAAIASLCEMNTAPLPARLLERVSTPPMPLARSAAPVEKRPRTMPVHDEMWPQDRPIARALALAVGYAAPTA